jgi:adenylate cyclase
MSMLFADVRGSTELSEKMSPTEFSRLINRFFREATRIISEEDGLVEQLSGDAVIAFWGAGFAGPDYIRRTIDVARTLVNTMGRLDIPVGVGVHAGLAYFGAFGEAEGLMNIAAIGDEVNLAARLVSQAEAGEIIVSEQALEKAGLSVDDLEPRQLDLKGISQPVLVRVIHA